MVIQSQRNGGNARGWISAVNLQAVHCLSRYAVAWAPHRSNFGRLAGEAGACARLSTMPILLLELCWQDAEEAGALRPEVDAPGQTLVSTDSLSASLTRQTLFLMWHLVQLRDPRLCLIDPGGHGVQRIRGLELGALDRLAAVAAKTLRLRWADESRYWDALIDAACRGDERELEQLFVRGLQMMGASSHARLIA
jgi:hypothetical protein